MSLLLSIIKFFLYLTFIPFLLTPFPLHLLSQPLKWFGVYSSLLNSLVLQTFLKVNVLLTQLIPSKCMIDFFNVLFIICKRFFWSVHTKLLLLCTLLFSFSFINFSSNHIHHLNVCSSFWYCDHLNSLIPVIVN